MFLLITTSLVTDEFIKLALLMYFHSLMQCLHVSVSMYMSAESAGVLKVVNNRLFTSTMIIVLASILD